MARSRKKNIGMMHRHPKGHKRAKKQGGRNKAIPPNPWEDIRPDSQCYLPFKIAFALHKKGWSRDDIVNRLVDNHGYDRWKIMKSYWYSRGFWLCDCEDCKNRRFV